MAAFKIVSWCKRLCLVQQVRKYGRNRGLKLENPELTAPCTQIRDRKKQGRFLRNTLIMEILEDSTFRLIMWFFFYVVYDIRRVKMCMMSETSHLV